MKETEVTAVLLLFALDLHCVSFAAVLLFWCPAITTLSQYLQAVREDMAHRSSWNTCSTRTADSFVSLLL